MSNFMSSGNTITIRADDSMQTFKRLPAATYVLKADREGNIFLETTDNFTIEGKLYGEIGSRTDRILNTYFDRVALNTSTGVMLTGEKGSGKSLLAKNLSIKALESNIPTIIINQPFVGDGFNRFLQLIDHECVVVFDEFEKVYDDKEQEKLLTVFDGVYQSKKLFVLTCNSRFRVDSNLINRPGRMYYSIEYKGISDAFIREYCEDKLQYKNYTNSICNVASVFENFNFDMLKALVEEINRYNESPAEILQMLNIKMAYSGRETHYDVVLKFNGVVIDDGLVDDSTLSINPLRDSVDISYSNVLNKKDKLKQLFTSSDDSDDSDADIKLEFTPENIVNIDSKAGVYLYEKDGYELTLTRWVRKEYDLVA